MNSTCFTFPVSQPGQAVWVPSPAYRGTFNIISLCLSTVAICVWSAIHWDIPLAPLSAGLEPVEGWSVNEIGKRIKRSSVILGRFLKQRGPLVLIAIFLPALLLFRAINQYFEAQALVKSVPEHWRPRKMASNSGKCEKGKKGYVEIGESDGPQEMKENSTTPMERDIEGSQTGNVQTSGERFEFTLVHAFYATMGGYAFTRLDERSKPLPNRMLLHGHDNAKITVKGLQVLIREDPNLIPDVSLVSISEKAKSNALGKTIMTIQVAWFCLNCISRLNEGLPLSLLEISTLAHGFCTLLSCAVWWHKPLNIDSPTWLRVDSDGGRKAYRALCLRHDPLFFMMRIDGLEKSGLLLFKSSPGFGDLFGAFAIDDLIELKFVIVSAITPIIYGSLHFLGWRAQFPTTTERILWRIATVAAMSPGVVAVVSYMILDPIYRRTRNESLSEEISMRSKKTMASVIIPSIYSIGSLYLLVESIRQLWYLSPDAFRVATWSYYVPHLF